MCRPRRLRPLLGLVCLGLFAGLMAGPAQATFPGGNGRIAYTWSLGGEAFEEGPSPRLVGVVSVRLDGGGRQLVARSGTRPRYSPDGRRIAFSRSRHLWVARADGRSARRVSPGDWRVGGYDWSPGETRLAFVRHFGNGGAAIYTVKPDGSGLQRLLKASQGITLAPGAWSPDGKGLVYEQHSLRTLVRVFRAGRITTLARASSEPTWSRRGLIAYATPVPGDQRGQVCVRRLEAPAPLRCFAFADASASDPTWSPDGRRLMFMYQPQGPAEIWTVRPDGTVLARAPRGNAFPIFSPDGRRLAFSEARFRLGLEFEDLFVMRADGSGKRRLVRGGQAVSPDWQPLR
jgi:Tol biopolymer transport system component